MRCWAVNMLTLVVFWVLCDSRYDPAVNVAWMSLSLIQGDWPQGRLLLGYRSFCWL